VIFAERDFGIPRVKRDIIRLDILESRAATTDRWGEGGGGRRFKFMETFFFLENSHAPGHLAIIN